MKTWSKPSIKKLDISSTEYFAITGTKVDGHYTSDDGKYEQYTYSGTYTGDIPFTPKD